MLIHKKTVVTRPGFAPKAALAKPTLAKPTLKPAGAKPTAVQPAAPKNPALVEAVARAEAAEKVKDYLLSTLTSGVRSPLAEIAENALKLRIGIDNQAKREAVMSELVEKSKALVQQVDDVLDLVDLNVSLTAPTDVIDLVNEAIASFRGEAMAKGLTLSCDMGDIPPLLLNGHRLRLVLRALLDNSVKFTTSGRIGVTASYFGERFRLSVEDTGCGIPLAEQQRFADEGLGGRKPGVLPSGLAVIENLVASMNGEISLQSTPGIGTVISLRIPGVKPAEVSGPDRRKSSMQRIRTMKIQDQLPWKANFLLVDKSPIQRAAIESMLRVIGFENISSASSGSEALVKIMTGKVDIVFTGMDLPQMNGPTLVAEIRKIDAFKDLPVYALTADESVVSSYKDLGLDGYLLKPITADKLHEVLG